MGDSAAVEEVQEAVAPVEDGDTTDLKLETMVLMLTATKVDGLEEKTRKELTELRERQLKVKLLHQLMKVLNAKTDSKGALDIKDDAEIAELLAKAKELGVDLDPSKTSYTKEERTLLVDNIRMTIEDFNVENEMQLQSVTRLTNERYEAYQLARSIMRPLHDVKTNMARGSAGR